MDGMQGTGGSGFETQVFFCISVEFFILFFYLFLFSFPQMSSNCLPYVREGTGLIIILSCYMWMATSEMKAYAISLDHPSTLPTTKEKRTVGTYIYLNVT